MVGIRATVAVVERRLEGIVILEIFPDTGAGALDEVRLLGVLGRPDEESLVRGGILVERLLEPWMLHRGVTSHQIDDDADAAAVRLGEESSGILIGAVAGPDLLVIADVVTGVTVRRIVEGIQPDRIHPERLDVVEFGGDAGEIAGSVTGGIVEALGIDLVTDGVGQPIGSRALEFSQHRSRIVGGDGEGATKGGKGNREENLAYPGAP